MRIKTGSLVREEGQKEISLQMSDLMERVRNLLRAIDGLWK
jgi:hypothetical protein